VRIGLEAGSLSQWLFSGVARAGLLVACNEARHTKTFLKAQVNKTGRNYARSIAQMMRVNLYRPVHVKTLASQKHRALLTAWKLLQKKAHAIENDIWGLPRNFGLEVGATFVGKFEERIRELVEEMPAIAEIMAPLLTSRRQLRQAYVTLNQKLLSVARDDAVCRRMMTIPGVGPQARIGGRAGRQERAPVSRAETDTHADRRVADKAVRPGHEAVLNVKPAHKTAHAEHQRELGGDGGIRLPAFERGRRKFDFIHP
jgi:transposase